MKTIFITGATGFIGKHLVKAIDTKKYKVLCMARQSSDTSFMNNLNVEKVTSNLDNLFTLSHYMKGVDVVIHLAANLGYKDMAELESTNIQGTKNLLQAAKESGVKRIIAMSSVSALMTNITNYGITKRESDKLIMESGIPYTLLRPSLILGKGCHGFERIVSHIKKFPFAVPIIGDGNFKTQPVHINDIVKLILNIIENESTLNKIYPCAGPTQLTFNDFVKLILTKMNKRKKLVHVPIKMCYAIASCFGDLESAPVTKNGILTFTQDMIIDISSTVKELKFTPTPLEKAVELSLKEL